MKTDGQRFSAGHPKGHDCRPINRRQFLVVGSGCVLGACTGATRASTSKWEPVDIGPLKNFTKDSISEDFIKQDFFVIRNSGHLFAASIICPHMSNTLHRDPQDDTRIVCSGHGSMFDAEGAVVSGLASSGLTRFGITVNDKGHVVVNCNQEYPQDKWTDKGCYIEFK